MVSVGRRGGAGQRGGTGDERGVCVLLAGTLSHGTLPGFNTTVLQGLPRSVNLIIVESALMAAAFLAMLTVSARAGGGRAVTPAVTHQ